MSDLMNRLAECLRKHDRLTGHAPSDYLTECERDEANLRTIERYDPEDDFRQSLEEDDDGNYSEE